MFEINDSLKILHDKDAKMREDRDDREERERIRLSNLAISKKEPGFQSVHNVLKPESIDPRETPGNANFLLEAALMRRLDYIVPESLIRDFLPKKERTPDVMQGNNWKNPYEGLFDSPVFAAQFNKSYEYIHECKDDLYERRKKRIMGEDNN